MKLTIQKLTPDKIFSILFILFAVVLPFGTAPINIAYGLIIAYWLFNSIIKRDCSTKLLYLVFFFSGFYILNTISLYYSDNLEYGINKIFLQSYLLIFPVIFLSKSYLIRLKLFVNIIQGLSVSLTVYSFLSLINQYIKFRNGLDFYSSFTENNLSASVVDNYFLGMSLIIAFTLISLSYINFFYKVLLNQFFKKIQFLVFIILFLFLILLNSRSIILISALLVGVIVFVNAFRSKNFKILYVFVPVIGVILLLNFSFNKAFNEKVKEVVNYEQQYDVDQYWGGRGIRLLIWDCGMKVVKQYPWLGVGVGDQQDVLTLCYKIYMMDQLLYNNKTTKNAHSIFLQISLSIGIIGLLFYVLSWIKPLKMVFFSKNKIYLYFAVLFLLAGISESFLERNLTVSFFSFFNILCFLTSYNNENTPSSQ